MAREADLGHAPRVAGEIPEQRRGGNVFEKLWRFLNESLAELKKVEWPGQSQVVQGTVVVLVACVIVGAYLWLNDQVWKNFVSHVLLR
jgi:preprotein translocase subunit SecE